MAAVTDKKLREKLVRNKKSRKEKHNRNDKTKHLRKEEQQKHNTGNTDIQPKKR